MSPQFFIVFKCQTVHHLRMERRRLQRFLTLLSDLVQRDEFHQSLINLKLLEVNRNGSTPGAGMDKCGCHFESGLETDQINTQQQGSNTTSSPDQHSFPRKMKHDVSEKDLSEMDEVCFF